MTRHDIDDNEIRVIAPSGAKAARQPAKKRLRWPLVVIPVAIVLAALTVLFFSNESPGEPEITDNAAVAPPVQEGPVEEPEAARATVTARDTTVDGVPLIILTPHNATASLAVGIDAFADSSAVLIAQAADVRADNGAITGAFVDRGRLLSKGERKAGFCAITGGKVNIGVAAATPCLEEALENEGYFFRQYPLVAGGQVVENKPRGRALRKALAELGGRPVVIASKTRLSFHDFSQALADLGVTEAIYLVGGEGMALARTGAGTLRFGKEAPEPAENINFILWK